MKVLADTYTFAAYWTQEYAILPNSDMPGPQEMATATLFAFTGQRTLAAAIQWARGKYGNSPPPVKMPSATMSPYYWDMSNATPSNLTGQTHHFAFYFALGFSIPNAAQASAVFGSLAQNKPQDGNFGDILLACTAASLGSQYSGTPRLNFQTALGVLKQTPVQDKTANALTRSGKIWNLSIARAYILLDQFNDLPP